MSDLIVNQTNKPKFGRAAGIAGKALRRSDKPLRRSDKAFLPDALAVIETPSAPLAGMVLVLICLFASLALVWSYFGRIDIVAVAQGKIHPVGEVKLVQSLVSGRLSQLPVRDGMSVKAGDLLFQLNADEARAEHAATLSELAGYKAEVMRREKAMDLVRRGMMKGVLPLDFGPEIPPDIAARKNQKSLAEIAALQATVDKIKADMDARRAERATLLAVTGKQDRLIELIGERVTLRQNLMAQSLDIRSNLMQAMEDLTARQAASAQDHGKIAEIEADLQSLARLVDTTIQAFLQDNSEKLDEAARQVALYEARLQRADWVLAQSTIRSPIDGIVQSVKLTTLGQVVEPGTKLMTILPDHAPLEVTAYLLNKDIAFVKLGQEAILKLDAFPFTRYGVVEAKVTRIGRDAIGEHEASQSETEPSLARRSETRAGADRVQNLVYPVTLSFETSSIPIETGEAPLSPGMTLTAEIKTDNQRLIDYLLSPIQQMHSEAMSER